MELKNKKVLVFGLGILGGGVSITNWLIKNGAVVTVTDLKSKKELLSSIKKIKGKVKFSLGGHNVKDFEDNDIIVLNQDVSSRNYFVELSRKMGKRIENEATIFYEVCKKPIVAITGTRGKTTTTNWTAHFIKNSAVVGNSPKNPLLYILDKKKFDVAVNEIPSFLLELFNNLKKSADVSVITNIYRDHLNRYKSFADYANTKANIFKNQNSKQHLILNDNNEWTQYFLKKKPKSKIWFFSTKSLTGEKQGLYSDGKSVFLHYNLKLEKVLDIKNFVEIWGEHNLENLLASSLAAHLMDVSWKNIKEKIKTLPSIPFRQEIIFQKKGLTVINDTTATSPEGGIAALRRFVSPHIILITGGTDRNLEFKEYAKQIKKYIKKENIIFLSGSATDKMLLFSTKNPKIFDNLDDCLNLRTPLKPNTLTHWS